MRAFKFLACLLTSLFPLSLPVYAAIPSYSSIYVFGDSYADVGNIFLATGGKEPLSPPYYGGRFSNGPLWIEHIAGALHLPMLPSLAGGTDYATGGAEVTQPYVTAQGTVPSVPQQVELYLSQHGGKADPRALYVIEGGGNDILNALGGSPQTLGYRIAVGIAQSELLLRQAGARRFLIPNLLDVGQLPGAQAQSSFATNASSAANNALDVLLQFEGYLQGIQITRVDEFTLFHAIASSPTHFGFTNITTPCLNLQTYAVCKDPDHTLFWDNEHLTEFGQGFFAVTVEQALTR